jgi:ankyrin repeat protein
MIASLLAIICSVCILFICDQESAIDAACMAIENHNNDIAKTQIDKVVNVNLVGTNNKTMLMVACESGNSDMIEYLIYRGADVNKTSPGYLSPLELFCDSGYEAGESALLVLLDAGIEQSAYVEKPAVFHLADNLLSMTEEQRELASKEIMLLLQYGSAFQYDQTSILHSLAKSNMADLFYDVVHTKTGLELMTMKDENGKTPWHISVEYGSIDVQRVIRHLETEYNDVQQEESALPKEDN